VCVAPDWITPAMAINKEIDLRFVLGYSRSSSTRGAREPPRRAAQPGSLPPGTGPSSQDVGPSIPTTEAFSMIVMFSARRLKPGAWEEFRRAWDPGESMPPGFQRAYHARNIRDEDELISFGLFDMSEDEYRRWRSEADAQQTQRMDRLSAFVQNDYVSGVYEVIDTVEE
jgi:heme-degrading monooxygenase HmoA